MDSPDMIWPEVFITGVFEYKDNTEGKLKATADALCAWANSHTCKRPDCFGVVMTQIGEFVGGCLPEELMTISEALLKQHMDAKYEHGKFYMVPNLNGKAVLSRYMLYGNTGNEMFEVIGGGNLIVTSVPRESVTKAKRVIVPVVANFQY